jgi:predicted ester cyclase
MEGYQAMPKRASRWGLADESPETSSARRAALLGFLAGTVAVALTMKTDLLGFGPANGGLAKAFSAESKQALVQYLGGGPAAPHAKNVILNMDSNIMLHSAWNDWDKWSKAMEPFWTEDMIYDFNYVGEWGFGRTKGLRNWYDGEHMHYNLAMPVTQWWDLMRMGNHQNATSVSYGMNRWVGEFAGVPPPKNKPFIRLRDIDFYLLEGDRIKVNWCLVDIIDMFEQVGYHVLPPAPLPNLGYLAPASMDGGPAPLSAAVDPKDTERAEATFRRALEEDHLLASADAPSWSENMTWYGPAGVGTARSRDEYVKHWLRPLHSAFSNITMQLDFLVCEGNYCGAHFYVWGRHTGEWMGEGPTQQMVPIRCGAHVHVDKQGRIVEGWLVMDTARAFKAMGVDLFARYKAKATELAKE